MNAPEDTGSQFGFEDEYSAFREFSEDLWFDWLNAFLRSEPCEPRINGCAEEYDAILIGLYLRLAEDGCRARFAEALVRLYESTQHIEENAETIFYQLQLISYIKPYRAKRLLRRNLLDSVLVDQNGVEINYNNHGLHVLLLSVTGEYDIDDTLTDYMYQSAERIKDFSYLLVCFRLLVSEGDKEAYGFLNRVIPNVESDIEAEDLSLELKAEFGRVGPRPFCVWYCNNANRLAGQWPENFERLNRMLKLHVVPSPRAVVPDPDNAYLILLSLQLYADEQRYLSGDIVEVARKHRYFGIALVTNALRNMFDRASHSWPDPWYFTSNAGLFEGKLRSNRGSITTETDQCTFDTHEEPDLVQIFESINTIYVLGSSLEELKPKAYAFRA